MSIRAPAGMFALEWSQTETDGMPGRPADQILVGAEWAWQGAAWRLDGPTDVLPLGRPCDVPADRQRRIQARADRIGRAAVTPAPRLTPPPPNRPGFTVTDGRAAWRGDFVDTPDPSPTLAVFSNGLPPQDTPLWVVEVQRATTRSLPRPRGVPGAAAMILPGATPGTPVATPSGPVPIETLRPGDLVLTRDHGPCPVQASVTRRISGVRLHLEPDLRPVILNRQTMDGVPWAEPIRISSAHRVLMEGPRPAALFHDSEVLIEARDLVSRDGARRDLACHSVDYHAVSLALPSLINLGGHWCEAAPLIRTPSDDALPPVRRLLSAPEAAILTTHA